MTLSIWDRMWLVRAAAIRDYYRERQAQKRKWEDFCQKCSQEIIEECINISMIINNALEKQSGSHVDRDIIEGIRKLPLYGFYLVLQKQGRATGEQERLLSLFVTKLNVSYSIDEYMQALVSNNRVRRDLISLVGISHDYAGNFWIRFFKVLYRTDEDTKYISELVESFGSITMRFAALSGKTEGYLLVILKQFLEDVHYQSGMCRLLPDDTIDIYGDNSFMDHFYIYKQETLKVCRMTMDENDEDLNPTLFFKAFTLGLVYQIIRRGTRNRKDKISIMDKILSMIDLDSSIDGNYIFKYMEDYHGEDTTMIAYMMHLYTDLEGDSPLGWNLLLRASGTYNLKTRKDVIAIEEAINFMIGLDNYLVDNYPMSGFGDIALNYAAKAMDYIGIELGKLKIID